MKLAELENIFSTVKEWEKDDSPASKGFSINHLRILVELYGYDDEPSPKWRICVALSMSESAAQYCLMQLIIGEYISEIHIGKRKSYSLSRFGNELVKEMLGVD